MHGRKVHAVSTFCILCVWLAACVAPAAAPGPSPTPETIEVPVTVQVTQMVTQTVLLEPTAVPPVPCAPDSLSASQVITVGAILPLSLPGAMVAGFGMQTAINVAVKEINDQGGVDGRPVRLITYDSAGQADRGVQFAQRLIVDDCAAGIVGLHHSSVAQAAAEVVHTFGTPVIIAEASSDTITARMVPEVFRLAPTTSMFAAMPAQWLGEVGDYNQDGALFAGLIVDNVTSSAYLDRMLAEFDQGGIGHEVLPVDLPSDDFSSVIARIVTKDTLPDALFVLVKGQAALTLGSQLISAGIGPQKSTLLVFHHAGLDAEAFWDAVPDGVGTVVARNGPWHTTLPERGEAFVQSYLQYGGRWPEANAFAAYDAVMLLADAVGRAGSMAGPVLVAALEEANLELAGGTVAFPYNSLNPPQAAGMPDYLWHQRPADQLLYLQYTTPQQPADLMAVIWPPRYRTVDDPVVR